jgi:hypothetical protein
MYNRYVDGLATWTPADPAIYDEMGDRIVAQGYLRPARRGGACVARSSQAGDATRRRAAMLA